jgi:hypothetical protein
MEYQSYEMGEWLSSNILSPTIGFTAAYDNGVFLDLEWLVKMGEADQPDDTSVTRDELTITSGYRLSNGISIFGGFKAGESEGYDEDADRWKIVTTGPFIGVSNAIALDKTSNLSFAVAMASMSAEVNLLTSGNLIENDGSATGLSGSVAYNKALTPSVSGSVGAKYQSYAFDQGIETETILSAFGKLSYRF